MLEFLVLLLRVNEHQVILVINNDINISKGVPSEWGTTLNTILESRSFSNLEGKQLGPTEKNLPLLSAVQFSS